MGLALPSLLNGVHEAVAEEIEHVLQTRQQQRGVKRNREEDDAKEGEEEEVEVEADEEVDPPSEEMAMMQTSRTKVQARPTAKEEAWKPLTPQERSRVSEIIRALLEFQTTPAPSLTVLACVEVPPVLCECEPAPEDEQPLEVSIGELPPALINGVGEIDTACASCDEVLLGIPGRTHPEPATMQAIARQLQSEVELGNSPILDQTLRGWADSADIGIVEEALKLALEGRNKAAVHRALARLRSTRRTPKQQGEERRPQLTLQSVWRAMPRNPGNGTDWAQLHEDPETLGVRTQLLGLQEAWSTLDKTTRKAIVHAILNVLPERRVQQQASSIAQIYNYNHIGDVEVPQSIITFQSS